MAIIEITGGPITHRYLMRKTKEELASMYMRLLRETEQDARDAERYRWLRDQRNRVAAADMALHKMNPDKAIDAVTQGANG